jgi:hypothetical protein
MRGWCAVLLATLLVGCGSEPEGQPPGNISADAGADGDDDALAPDTGADAGPADAPPEAAPDAAGTDAGGGAPTGPAKVRYPYGPLQSPMTPEVIARLESLIAKTTGRKDVFAKVGDSHTVSTNFSNCFAGSDVKYGAYPELDPARQFFKKTLADGTRTSFDRTTLAAVVGWSTLKPATGSPSPIEQEVAAIKPAWALVMLGTNDTYATGVQPFDRALRTVVDELEGLKVAPILTTIPPRSDSATATALVPEMNAIVRAVAQAKAVPLIDLETPLYGVPQYGLAGDGIHMNAYYSGGAHPCWLTTEGLTEGQNWRNLLTLQALDRVKRFVLEKSAPEARPPALLGKGTWAAPYVVDDLPFVDHGTTVGGADVANVYACSSADEGGPEVVYEITLTAPARLRARVLTDDGVDLDLHWLSGATASTCVSRADKVLDVDVTKAGTYRLVVDSYVTGGSVKAGGYRLTLLAR